MDIKNRIVQPLLLTGMIILNIIYNIGLLLFAPIFWLGAIFWKTKTFWKMYDFWFEKIPNIP